VQLLFAPARLLLALFASPRCLVYQPAAAIARLFLAISYSWYDCGWWQVLRPPALKKWFTAHIAHCKEAKLYASTKKSTLDIYKGVKHIHMLCFL